MSYARSNFNRADNIDFLKKKESNETELALEDTPIEAVNTERVESRRRTCKVASRALVGGKKGRRRKAPGPLKIQSKVGKKRKTIKKRKVVKKRKGTKRKTVKRKSRK